MDRGPRWYESGTQHGGPLRVLRSRRGLGGNLRDRPRRRLRPSDSSLVLLSHRKKKVRPRTVGYLLPSPFTPYYSRRSRSHVGCIPNTRRKHRYTPPYREGLFSVFGRPTHDYHDVGYLLLHDYYYFYYYCCYLRERVVVGRGP